MCIFRLQKGAKFSSEIPDLYLVFIEFTVEKIDSHTQVVP